VAPLITLDQLGNRLQSTPDPGAGEQAITDASGLVRAVARQHFTFVAQETVVLGGGTRVLTLPERPLVVDAQNPLTVVELGEYGEPDVTVVEKLGYTRLGNELTRSYPWFPMTRLQGWPRVRYLGVWAYHVQVTYSHGELVTSDDVTAIVLDVAQSLYTNPTGLRSWQVPEYTEVYATELLGAATVDSIRRRLSATGRKRTTHSI
jgi:hypothetical protein